MRVKLNNMDRWEAVSGGGITVELLLSPMTKLEKLAAAEAAQACITTTVTVERPDGSVETTTTSQPVPGAITRGTRQAFECCVNGWKGIEDEEGRPIPYSLDALDRLMGLYPAWGEAAEEKMKALNPMEKAGAGPLAPPPTSDSSPSS